MQKSPLPALIALVACGAAMGLSGACGSLDQAPTPTARGGASGNAGATSTGGGLNAGGATGGSTSSGAGTSGGGAVSVAGAGGASSTVRNDAATDVGADTGPSGPMLDASTDSGAASSSDGASLGSCPTTATELCDGFESGQIDLQKWKITKPTASATIAVDDTRPHTGKYSLHIKVVPGQSSVAQIADAVTFPAESNTFYTRAFVFLAPDLPADNNGGFHTSYLLATGNNDLGFVEAGLASAGTKQYLGYSEYYGSGPDNHAHGATFTEFGPRSQLQVVPMKWICMELMQGGNATTTMRRVWVDGTELPEQKSDYTARKPPQFSLISIGILEYHPTPLLSDAWFDDVRVSKQPIGCNL